MERRYKKGEPGRSKKRQHKLQSSCILRTPGGRVEGENGSLARRVRTWNCNFLTRNVRAVAMGKTKKKHKTKKKRLSIPYREI